MELSIKLFRQVISSSFNVIWTSSSWFNGWFPCFWGKLCLLFVLPVSVVFLWDLSWVCGGFLCNDVRFLCHLICTSMSPVYCTFRNIVARFVNNSCNKYLQEQLWRYWWMPKMNLSCYSFFDVSIHLFIYLLWTIIKGL